MFSCKNRPVIQSHFYRWHRGHDHSQIGHAQIGHSHDHGPGQDHPEQADHPADPDSSQSAGPGSAAVSTVPPIPAAIDSVTVMTAIYDENDRIAAETNRLLQNTGIMTVNVMGAPGAGKTSAIIALVNHLPQWHHYVLEGDIESDIDTQALRRLGVTTLQINTHGACHLDAPLVAQAIRDFRLEGPGLLLIENIGNLVCPAEFMIGEHCKVLVVTVADGSDKPYKYPLAFEKADLILLNKADLLPYVDFDQAYFLAGVRALNPRVAVLPVNARQGEGFAAVADWFHRRAVSIFQA